jgi:hypothetical protein
MTGPLARRITSAIRRLSGVHPALTDLRQQVTDLQQHIFGLQQRLDAIYLDAIRRLSGVHPALTDLRQQVTDLQQHIFGLQQRLDAIYLDPNTRRRTLNETTGTNQAVQLLLHHKYRELLYNHFPLPELADTEFRCFSQNGEDGILLYIFTILGATNKRAVEICAGDGIECNSANLIINHGWYGLLFDGDEHNISRGKDFYSKCQDTFSAPPTLVASWITAENINSLIVDNGFGGEIDLLSMDIDGIDYWVWRAIECISPRVVILEFNSVWGPDRAVSIPYRADFRMDFSRRPYYTGASLSAFVKLARVKGYRLVGIERLGFNALFVRSGVGEDLLPEVSPRECFQRHTPLRTWGPHWIPDVSHWPEWRNIVEV